jgi:hypothetical protein
MRSPQVISLSYSLLEAVRAFVLLVALQRRLPNMTMPLMRLPRVAVLASFPPAATPPLMLPPARPSLAARLSFAATQLHLLLASLPPRPLEMV